MITKIVSSEVQKFIRDHANSDEKQIVLKQKSILGIPSSVIAEQITGRRKAKEKIPLYHNTEGVIYPPAINLEQSSSQATASLKLSILSEVLNASHQEDRSPYRFGRGVDLTGGFGIDTFFLSKLFSQINYVEPNLHLLEISRQNHLRLSAGNIIYHNITAEIFLNTLDQQVDLIYIDPSRRTQDKKIFTLNNSEPDIISLQSRIFEKTSLLFIKASPMLDIKKGIEELSFVKEVFVVAVENEVKELLFLCEKNFQGLPQIKAINMTASKTESFQFNFSEESGVNLKFSDPLLYLYEPNAAIMKAGAFKSICNHYQIRKIQSSTHLYTANELDENFPGRIFKIEAFVKPETKFLKQHLPGLKANIITRNYPLTVDELKKKSKVKDGGEKYLIGFSGANEKFLALVQRIK